MRRTYLFRRLRIAHVGGAVVAAVVLAGCGSSGSTPATTAAAATVAPAGTTTAGAFDPSLVATPKKGSSGNSGTGSSSDQSSSNNTPVSSASQALALASGAVATTTTATTPAKTTPAVTTTPVVKTPTTRTVTKIVYRPSKPKIKYVTVTKYKTKTNTVTKTTTVTTPPKVPIGAFLPSVHAAMSLTSFIVQGRGVGCVIGGGSVRCDVAKHTWTPPAQPSSCTQAWGSGIVLINSRSAKLPQFSCGGGSALDNHDKVVKNGYDVTVGQITCQVRGFGVDCFASDDKGFILSNTGYILY